MEGLAATLLHVLNDHRGMNYCEQCLAQTAGVATATGFDAVTQFMQEARAGLWGKLTVNKTGPCSLCRQPTPTIGKPHANMMGAA
ncbi:MAG: hypothetical protein KGI53_12700 [Nitrospirota bacterium]|nr:hypothetical protein [Nitrospirota bacterium]